MPWPRRSKVTRRKPSQSALSYCFAQQRWFCDQPWMNRMGGASPLPHSRTCSCSRPPPTIRCVFIAITSRSCCAGRQSRRAALETPLEEPHEMKRQAFELRCRCASPRGRRGRIAANRGGDQGLDLLKKARQGRFLLEQDVIGAVQHHQLRTWYARGEL